MSAATAGEARGGATSRAWRDAAVSVAVLGLAIAGYGVLGFRLGADGNADLRNYHYYNGWALLHKPVGVDLIPAGVQSYFHPLLDALYWLVLQPLNTRPLVFTVVWSIPQAVAAWIGFHIARLCFAEAGRARDALALIAAVIGAGGATSVGVVGTSMSEAVPDALILAGVWLILSGPGRAGRAGLAGVLAGIGTVMKLTTASLLVAFVPAILLLAAIDRRGRWLRTLAGFVAGAALGLAVTGGPFWWEVWRVFGNPLFPYYNSLFRSPLYPPTDFFDDRFLAHGWREWLLYPLEWTLRKSRRVSEMPVRDARILLAAAGSVVLLGVGLGGRLRGRWATLNAATIWLAAFVLVAYGLWLRTFSILRYASALELLAGPITVAAIVAILPARRIWLACAGSAAAAAAVLATTVVPTWERRPHPTGPVVAVSMRPLPADSTVLILVPTPASYVAAWAPTSVRFLGVRNNLLALDSTFGMRGMIEQAIVAAPGPLWGIENLSDFFGQADETLAHYRLRRTTECSAITSTLDTALQICRLERVPG